jgi:DNA polymerase III subunit epsilon
MATIVASATGSPVFGKKISLDSQSAERLQNWRNLPAHASRLLAQARFVIVDVETSGLNPNRDPLIAIGAVAVREARIDLEDSFEVILRQTTASGKDNILVHGIGDAAQTNGVPPVEGLLCFLDYLGKDPLIAFHVTFDATAFRRALRKVLNLNFKHVWLDLAYVIPALYPEQSGTLRTLDDWMHYFGIRNSTRHNALADAMATAELLLIVLKKAHQAGIHHLGGLLQLEKAQRWVSWAR